MKRAVTAFAIAAQAGAGIGAAILAAATGNWWLAVGVGAALVGGIVWGLMTRNADG